ncbi:DUB-associated factor 1 [Frankliniella fusca]|uniref:DUB-associated factor 1 n=1 Tax=Frankliniella fusca TaxID=407009 RepID=A0AAE1LSW8_9NEOP|nr:DUB-associated factor 1 [Frankliniella fusca]KAK3919262.1 DUB-associated factor 1 [Frankliniella fusca]KAK3920570.1 DUB-associated factor 1 [Frankliniella fusca]KAK3922027.1 DUB-associated factor 1 [Frankliniella fusca]KAK3923442.1 DUB-associated factor 1 [Frankliniella fusca]
MKQMESEVQHNKMKLWCTPSPQKFSLMVCMVAITLIHGFCTSSTEWKHQFVATSIRQNGKEEIFYTCKQRKESDILSKDQTVQFP